MVGCVSVSLRPDRIDDMLTELDTADLDTIMARTAIPFLLDGEPIARERDVRIMWQNLRDAGFRFTPAQIVRVDPRDEASYRQFGQTEDVRIWFDRYTAEDAGLAVVNTEFGQFLIVTGGRERRRPLIWGLTGPIGPEVQ